MKDKSQTAKVIVSALAALLVIGFAGFVLGRRSTHSDGTAAPNSAKLRESESSALTRSMAHAPIAKPLLSEELSRMLQIVDKIQTPYLGYVEAGRTSTFGDRNTYIQGLVGGLALAYARGDDRAADAISATSGGDLSEAEADLAVRIVLETRNAYRTAPCDPRTSTPFPKPDY